MKCSYGGFCNRHCHSCHFDALQLIVREHGGVNCPYSCPTNQREPDATQHLISLPFMQLASIICAHQGKLQFLCFFSPSKFQHRQHGNSRNPLVFLSWNCALSNVDQRGPWICMLCAWLCKWLVNANSRHRQVRIRTEPGRIKSWNRVLFIDCNCGAFLLRRAVLWGRAVNARVRRGKQTRVICFPSITAKLRQSQTRGPFGDSYCCVLFQQSYKVCVQTRSSACSGL